MVVYGTAPASLNGIFVRVGLCALVAALKAFAEALASSGYVSFPLGTVFALRRVVIAPWAAMSDPWRLMVLALEMALGLGMEFLFALKAWLAAECPSLVADGFQPSVVLEFLCASIAACAPWLLGEGAHAAAIL